jgi:hypothetical protein
MMARLIWDSIGSRFYELGLDRGVLYVSGEDGVAWSGLISVTESPSGGESTAVYYEGSKYANVETNSNFEASLEAFTYPDVFGKCDGSIEVQSGLYATAQKRTQFGLAYRTIIGNDLLGITSNYKIHLVYNAKVIPTDRKVSTITETTTPDLFAWQITTTPEQVPGKRPTAHFVIDTRNTPESLITELEDVLYGTSSYAPALPTVLELLDMFESHAVLKVYDNGDGTFTVDGPDSAITMLNPTTFQITWPSAIYLDPDTYTISSF